MVISNFDLSVASTIPKVGALMVHVCLGMPYNSAMKTLFSMTVNYYVKRDDFGTFGVFLSSWKVFWQ